MTSVVTELMIGEVLTLEDEDLIEETDVLITLSNKGYIKRLDQGEFTAQKTWWPEFKVRELRMMTLCELVSTSTHDHLLFFTNKGRVYRLKKVMKSLNMVVPLRDCQLSIY